MKYSSSLSNPILIDGYVPVWPCAGLWTLCNTRPAKLAHQLERTQLDGPAAIVSTYRLQNEFYGGPPDKDLLLERLIKETTHELGHSFGLYHCQQQRCVMNFSTYVEDIDDKSPLFCEQCKSEIEVG